MTKEIDLPPMGRTVMYKPECQTVSTEDLEPLAQWLEDKAQTHQLTYLLAHAEDGVIWGRFDQGHLVTSDQVFPKLPKLRLSTLQRCHVFGQAGEILLWRSHNAWKHRFIGNPDCDSVDEAQMLWGTHLEGVDAKNHFTLVADGSEGLRHAVPLINIPFDRTKLIRPLRLNIRHYIDYDEAGVARIYLSRLVSVTSQQRDKHNIGGETLALSS